MRRWHDNGHPLCVAVGADELVALPKASAPIHVRIDGGDLAAAFMALKGAAKEADLRVIVAVLPPLANSRMLEAPNLRQEELRRGVEQSPQRHFLSMREPVIVSASHRQTLGHGRMRTLVSALPAERLVAINAAVQAVGGRVIRIVPGEAAWAAAMRVLWPAPHGAPRWHLVVHAGGVLHLLSGGAHARLESLRRLPADDHERLLEALTAAAPTDDARAVALCGPSSWKEGILARLPAVATPATSIAVAEDAALLAAAGAMHVPAHAGFHTPVERADLAARLMVRVRVAWAAAVVIVLAAGALQQWDVRRELDATVTDRAALADLASIARVRQERARAIAQHTMALHASVAAAPQPVDLLVDLAETLPDDAYLHTVRADGDSLTLEGYSQDVDNLVRELTGPAPVRHYRFHAPPQWDSTAVIAHWTFALTLHRTPELVEIRR